MLKHLRWYMSMRKKRVDKRKKPTPKRHAPSKPKHIKTKRIMNKRKTSKPTNIKVKKTDKRKKPTLNRQTIHKQAWAKVLIKSKIAGCCVCPFRFSKSDKTKKEKNHELTLKEQLESSVQIKPTPEEQTKIKTVWLAEYLEDIEAIEPSAFTTVSALAKPEEKSNSTQIKNKQCKYYFGYLGSREKGEEIPKACYECSKFVNCVLSNLNQARRSK